MEAPPAATPAVESPVPEASEEKPSAATESPAPDDLALVENNPPDPPPVTTGPIDPSKIEIIETKVIPRPGSQQPPKNGVNDPAQPATIDPPSAAAAPAGTPEPQPSLPRPPVAVPHPEAPPSVSQTAHAPGEGRTGVIIPDSLKSSPAASPASSLEPSSVPEETSLGLVIHRVEPQYPQQALSQHLEGPVVLQAWIARDGSVRDLKLVKGYFVLGRAAFDAVKQWRFKPYSPNGKAIDFQTVLTVNFKYPN